METAGNKEFDEDTEKKGLGTPATRAGIIEKLIYSQYATRKGKKILPTDDGKVLVEILPDFLKSASMTAEWENQLLLMEHGEIAPEQCMTGIKNMLTMMLKKKQEDFRPEKVLEPVRYVEAWYTKVKPTSIAVTTIAILLSGKITAICRAWKKPWIKRWLQNF